MGFQNNVIRCFNGWCVCVCVCEFWYSDMVQIFLFLCEMCKQFCIVVWYVFFFVDVNDISFDSQHFKLFDFIICAVTYWFRVYTKTLLYFLANKCKTLLLKIEIALLPFSVCCKRLLCFLSLFFVVAFDRKWSALFGNISNNFEMYVNFHFPLLAVLEQKLFQLNLNHLRGERSIMFCIHPNIKIVTT